jgi:hypothetical protein
MRVARLHLERLSCSDTPKNLKSILGRLSDDSDIDKTYDESITRISSDDRDLAFTVFSWVALAHRPFTMEVLLHAIATDWDNEEQLEIGDADLHLPDRVLEVCQGLVVTVPRSQSTSVSRYEEEVVFVRKFHINFWESCS